MPNDRRDKLPPSQLNELFANSYEELRRRAARTVRADPFATISADELVSEVWLKLSAQRGVEVETKERLTAIVTRTMRQVLVDHARYRRRVQRVAGSTPIENDVYVTWSAVDDALGIEDALSDLERLDPELARIIHLRYFGGFSLYEIAQHMGVSESTVYRKHHVALARLGNAMAVGSDATSKSLRSASATRSTRRRVEAAAEPDDEATEFLDLATEFRSALERIGRRIEELTISLDSQHTRISSMTTAMAATRSKQSDRT